MLPGATIWSTSGSRGAPGGRRKRKRSETLQPLLRTPGRRRPRRSPATGGAAATPTGTERVRRMSRPRGRPWRSGTSRAVVTGEERGITVGQ